MAHSINQKFRDEDKNHLYETVTILQQSSVVC